MKKANNETDYILIKAYTGSEWDACEFAVIHITNEWKAAMQKRLEAISAFKDDHTFYSHIYWDAPEGYYSQLTAEDKNYSITDELLGEYEEWCFVTIAENELQSFSVPENKLDTHQFCITKYGLGRFEAYGKHTGEGFYTADFDIASIIGTQSFSITAMC